MYGEKYFLISSYVYPNISAYLAFVDKSERLFSPEKAPKSENLLTPVTRTKSI
jgi:hypothetical protein